MPNTVKVEFAGDAKKLQAASKDAVKADEAFEQSVKRSSDVTDSAAKSAQTYTDRVGRLGAGVEGMSGAFDNAGAAVQAMADLQQAGAERASRLARAANDVKQATEDMAQAQRDAAQATIDGEQAIIDEEQARLDQATALKEYNAAVKEHGAASEEARQAQIDMKQAGLDVKQAQEDAAQAVRDSAQAAIDAEAAQNDLNDSMREANPTGLQKWAENINMITPILSGLIGVVGLVTAAQWAWNAAQLASPTTWIILAIAALVAIIVVIATKTDWFQRAWKVSWGAIKSAAAAVGSWFKDTLWGKWIKGAWDAIVGAAARTWNYLKTIPNRLKGAFSQIAGFILSPFRSAFNGIARAWNATIGSLSFTVPGWVPGIGGNSINVPDLPTFHSGGTVPGVPGSDVLVMAQAGERISPASSSKSSADFVPVDLGALGDALLAVIAPAVQARGGRVTALGVAVVGGQARL